MSNDQHYLMQVAQMRQQKAQQEAQVEYNQALYGRQESLANRQEIERQAATTADPEERQALMDQWHYYDAEVQANEATIRQLTPRQVTQEEQAMARFMQRNNALIERHGQAGLNALDLAHRYATAPRNPNAHNPAHTGMGLRAGTRPYFEAMRSLLELYGKDVGVPYDRNEESLSWREAAKASGLSEQNYANAYRALKAQGRVK